jgi:hypothetical protein
LPKFFPQAHFFMCTSQCIPLDIPIDVVFISGWWFQPTYYWLVIYC